MKNLNNYVFLKEKFKEDFPQFYDSFENICIELERFFQLVEISKTPLAVMSPEVDALWHTFILQTKQYEEFCMLRFGEYVHHQSHTKSLPVPKVAISNLYTKYQNVFGVVPDMWLKNLPIKYHKLLLGGKVPRQLLSLQWSGYPGK